MKDEAKITGMKALIHNYVNSFHGLNENEKNRNEKTQSSLCFCDVCSGLSASLSSPPSSLYFPDQVRQPSCVSPVSWTHVFKPAPLPSCSRLSFVKVSSVHLLLASYRQINISRLSFFCWMGFILLTGLFTGTTKSNQSNWGSSHPLNRSPRDELTAEPSGGEQQEIPPGLLMDETPDALMAALTWSVGLIGNKWSCSSTAWVLTTTAIHLLMT